MLALETTDNWAFSVDIDVGGAETYTNAEANAIDSVYALVLWANNPARGWFGVASFAWSWARHVATGGTILTLTSTAPFGFTMTAGAHDRLGLPADVGASEIIGDQPATGTWAPASKLSVKKYMRTLDRGDANGDGGVRPGVPGLGAYRPEVTAVGTVIDSARLAAVLATASNPRRAVVYQLHTDDWITLAIGSVNRSPAETMHYRFEIQAGGVSL